MLQHLDVRTLLDPVEQRYIPARARLLTTDSCPVSGSHGSHAKGVGALSLLEVAVMAWGNLSGEIEGSFVRQAAAVAGCSRGQNPRVQQHCRGLLTCTGDARPERC